MLTDLKRRGLLDSTLVIWGASSDACRSRRAPAAATNLRGFLVWMAGAGVQGGVSYGETDEIGYRAAVDDARFPYHERGPYKPDKPATSEHLLACMREAEVDYAIVVDPEPYQDDHRYLEHCLEVGNDKLKGTLLLFADCDGSLDKMPELCRKLSAGSDRVSLTDIRCHNRLGGLLKHYIRKAP